MEVAAAPFNLSDRDAANYKLNVYEERDPDSRVLAAVPPHTRLRVLTTVQLDDASRCSCVVLDGKATTLGWVT